MLAGLGVFAFSLTFPATAWGLESFGPWSLVALRTLLGAVIAGGALLLGRVAPPDPCGTGPGWPWSPRAG